MNWESLITPAVLFLLTVVVFPLIRAWIEKIQSERIRDIGRRAMDFADSEANRQLKDNEFTLRGEEKKSIALEYALDLASAAKIKIDPETMGKVIEEAIGATKKK